MVKNKTQLVEAANAWVGKAKADIANKTREFMARTNLTPERVAGLLDTDANTVYGMLNGTLDIPMSLFAKIIISTGHSLCIMPEGALREMQEGRGMRQSRQNRRQPRDPNGRFVRAEQTQMPPMGYPMPPMPNGYPMPNGMNMPPFGGYQMPPQQNGYPMPAPEAVFGDAPEPMEVEEEHNVQADAPNPQASKDDAINALVDAVRANPALAEMFGAVLDKFGQD